MSPIDQAKKVWGVGTPKTFRLAAWGIAIGAFAAWQYYDNKPVIVHHNNNINNK